MFFFAIEALGAELFEKKPMKHLKIDFNRGQIMHFSCSIVWSASK